MLVSLWPRLALPGVAVALFGATEALPRAAVALPLPRLRRTALLRGALAPEWVAPGDIGARVGGSAL